MLLIICLFAWLCLNIKLFNLLYSGQPFYLGGSEDPVADSKDAIRPLVRDGVKLAIQLAHGDGFGINNRDLYLVLIHQTLV